MEKIIDHFELESEQAIDETGMFNVYKAKDIKENRPVILKILKDEYSKDKEIVQRFHDYYTDFNVRNTAHLAKVYTTSTVRNRIYLVQEYIKGKTLTEYLHDNPNLKTNDFKRIFKQICDGLQSLHARQFCHYKVVPTNIMINNRNNVKLVGFGSLFLALGNKDLIKKLVIDTKDSIAPEILSGKDKDRITKSCDIYSLGKVIESLPIPINKTILSKALEKDPGKRYKSVRKFEEKKDNLFIDDESGDGKKIKENEVTEKPEARDTAKLLDEERISYDQPQVFTYNVLEKITKESHVKIKGIQLKKHFFQVVNEGKEKQDIELPFNILQSSTGLKRFAEFDEQTCQFRWQPGKEHSGKHILRFEVTTDKEKRIVELPINVKPRIKVRKKPKVPEETADNTTATSPQPESGDKPFDAGMIGKSFLWIYNLILFFAGAFGVVFFLEVEDFIIGFALLGILECLYLLVATSSEKFQKFLEKKK